MAPGKAEQVQHLLEKPVVVFPGHHPLVHWERVCDLKRGVLGLVAPDLVMQAHAQQAAGKQGPAPPAAWRSACLRLMGK